MHAEFLDFLFMTNLGKGYLGISSRASAWPFLAVWAACGMDGEFAIPVSERVIAEAIDGA
jgi:hypothetical protein